MSPLDESEGEFLALRNDEGQYSLWPAFIEVPSGWTTEYGPERLEKCVEHIETCWISRVNGAVLAR